MKRALAAGVAALLFAAAGGARAAGHVNLVVVSGSINPASADYLERGIAESEGDGAAALVIQLDTPGGLLASTKDIIQAILNARVPVIVYVAPRGAWAGSAGTFITLAGHVAAMAPGTSIGAAHPVGLGAPGGADKEERDSVAERKMENFAAAFIESIARERKRNVSWAVKAVRESVAIPWEEAVKLGVVDLVAEDLPDLLRKSDGREVRIAGSSRRLAVADASVREIRMGPVTRFFDVLADPNLAVMLILAGLLSLYVEFTTPGVIVPGVVGGICLLLGCISLQILPFSWVGLLLLLGGIGLLVAEVFVSSFGVLFALGAAAFLLGGAMLFDRPEISDLNVSFWTVLVPTVAGISLFGAAVVFGVGRSLRRPPVSGVHELVGLIGRAESVLAPEGTVFVRGEYWQARAEEPVAAGGRVEVTAVEGLRLRVRRAPAEGPG